MLSAKDVYSQFNEELAVQASLDSFPFDAIITERITEIRFWRDEFLSVLDHLIMVCTGKSIAKKKKISVRRVVEIMIEIFPMVTRVIDVENKETWEGESTVDLVECLVSDWNIKQLP